ncbi:MAG: SLBB domain-containing protein [Terracidiphilus sp.]
MVKKFSLLLLTSSVLCAAQSVPANSESPAQSSPSPYGLDNSFGLSQSDPVRSNFAQSTPSIPRIDPDADAAKAKRASDPESKSGDESEVNLHSPAKVLQPLRDHSDFEFFVADAVGHPLNVYARQLFDEVPSTFAPLDRIPVPASYVIGPGDELMVRVWGKVEVDATVTVDRNGLISLPKVGALNVAGLRYEQLDGYLHAAIGAIYKGFELSITLGRLRSIQVFVLGNARQPGAYTLGSLSTLVDALFASGGPSATGTMRRIQLRRGDRLLTEFDVYDLQQKGDKSHDVQLLPGDVIYIPPVGPQVALDGNVNTPGIFELKHDATVASVLEGAGGLTNLAAPGRVLLERIESHKTRIVDEFVLDGSGMLRPLKDGDLLRIFPISPKFENAVTLRGNVSAAGRSPWHDGMRITDLIPSRDFLVTNTHWNLQNHSADNAHPKMMTDLPLTNAEINWEYAVIERLDEHDLSTRLIAFNLSSAIDHPMSSDNQFLKIGDIVTIFSRKDIPLPLEKHATFVQLSGEVNAPGVYRVKPGDTLRDVVLQAGGLTRHSYLYAAQLTRASIRQVQQEQMQLSISRLEKQVLSQYAYAPKTNSQVVSDPQAQLNAQQALIAHMSSARPSGRIVLGMRPDAKVLGDIPDIPLEDGDSFFVPSQLGTIQVIGEVYNENAFRYEVDKRLSWYLHQAGGPTRIADAKRIYLIRADGTVVSSQNREGLGLGNFERLALMPGDAIIVPPKLKSPSWFMEELPFISQMVSQTAMTGGVLSVLK